MHAQQQASISLSGLTPGGSPPWGVAARDTLEWAVAIGYRWVQVDVTRPGLRPRELDQSARREVHSLLRRRGTGISGLDLFIPPQHFVDPARVDRAAAAVRESLELAAAWGMGSRMSVSVSLPAGVNPGMIGELCALADRLGAVLSDASWPTCSVPGIGLSLDPAAVLAQGGEVLRAAAGGPVPASARLSDLSSAGRVEAGAGRLDVTAYRVALSVRGYDAPLVVDLRGLRDQAGAAARLLGLVQAPPG